jgi:predicted CXXCH cytochrome family protein
MKKIALTAAALMLTAGTAFGAATPQTTPGKIQNSKHDMNFTFNSNSGTGEICIYCHTPHNAVVAVPLWNRNNPTGFTLYNSPTLTTAAKASNINTTTSISLFCMSCHDGVTGLGDVVNKNVVTANGKGILASVGANDSLDVVPSQAAGEENARLGKDLTTTHPIGFDFTNVPGTDSGIFDAATIKSTFQSKKRAGATDAQEFLYGPGNNMFECASCHRVHDPGTSGNFLRIENGQSQLCLACHNK